MQNVIFRIIGSIGFSVCLGISLDAGSTLTGFMGGFIYLLVSSTNND